MDRSEIGQGPVTEKLNRIQSLRVIPETFSNPALFFKNIPAQTGTYCLIFHLRKNLEIPVGALGNVEFREGYYCYVGSAFGSGGLRARLKRHLEPTKRLHWHIDYLSVQSNPVSMIFQTGTMKKECTWVEIMEKITGCRHLVKRFGSSDCQYCFSHLLWLQNMNEREIIALLDAHSH